MGDGVNSELLTWLGYNNDNFIPRQFIDSKFKLGDSVLFELGDKTAEGVIVSERHANGCYDIKCFLLGINGLTITDIKESRIELKKREYAEDAKPTPKFKVGDRVNILNWDKIGLDQDDYLDCHQVKDLIDYPNVELRLFPKKGNDVTPIWINKIYLSLKESKDKWSVGTYIESLIDEDYLVKDRIYTISGEFSIECNTIGIKFSYFYYNIDLNRLNKLESEGKIKWHENKHNIDLTEHLKRTIAVHESFTQACGISFDPKTSDPPNKYCTFDDVLNDKSRYDKYILPTHNWDFKTPYSNESTREAYIKYIKENPPVFDECYNKLSKPEITISKVKETHININKPKIN